MKARPQRRAARNAEPPLVLELYDDVMDHLRGVRRYYFDVVSTTPDEVVVALRRRETARPIGFRSRRP